MSNPKLRLLALLLIAFSSTLAMAKDKSHPCADKADPTERLECYDLAFTPIANAQSLEALREKAKKEFGLNRTQLRERTPDRLRDLEPSQIEASVTSITDRPGGERLVRLDNGQVWLLTEGSSRGRLAAGDKVKVRNAALTTFMLVTPGGASLRARRLQ